VKVDGSVLSALPGSVVSTFGGTGSHKGGTGRFIDLFNAEEVFSPFPNGTTELGAFGGPTRSNPFLAGQVAEAATPLIPDLVGGAEAFGLTQLTLDSLAGVVANAPPGAAAALVLASTSPTGFDSFPGYQYVFFVNLLDQPLGSPTMGLQSTTASTALIKEGFANDPFFGGGGAVPLGQLGAHQVYATLIPNSAGSLANLSFTRGGMTFSGSGDLGSGPIYVTGVLPPTAFAQSLNMPQGTAVILTLGAYSPLSDPLTYEFTSPAHGVVTGTAPNLTYTPSASFSGVDSFTFQAIDAGVPSSAATVQINVIPVNHPPTAGADSYGVPEYGSLNVAAPGVLGNDADPDGDPLQASLLLGPSHGTLSLNSDGSFAYAPNTSYSGSDAFVYKVSDGRGGIDVATATVTVTPASATHFGISAPTATTAGTPFTVTVTALDQMNNLVPGYTGAVALTSSDGQAILTPAAYTFTIGGGSDNGTHSFTATLKTAGPQWLTVADATDNLSTTLSGIVVAPSVATHFALLAPTSVSAGSTFSITVTALDAYGNIATDYRGTVKFSGSDNGASLPGKYKFTAADNGTRTFANLVAHKKGKLLISVFDDTTNTISGTALVDIT
jgi:hypothetical protein